MVFDNLDLSLDYDQLDAKPSFGNLAVGPLFLCAVGIALPNFTRRSLNIRRALKRYDAQPSRNLDDPAASSSIPAEWRVGNPAASGRKTVLGFVKRAAFFLLTTATALLILAPTADRAGWISSFNQHGIPVFFGFLLSCSRPFSSWLLYESHTFVCRAAPSKTKDGQVDPGRSQFVSFQVARSDLNMLPPWAGAILNVIRPVILSLLMVTTGTMVPIIFLCFILYKSTAAVPFGASLRRVLFLSLRSIIFLCSVKVLTVELLNWASSGQDDTKKEAEAEANTEASASPATDRSSNILNVCSVLVFAFLPVFPLIGILAAARNYDLHNLEQEHGSLEAAVESAQAEFVKQHRERCISNGEEHHDSDGLALAVRGTSSSASSSAETQTEAEAERATSPDKAPFFFVTVGVDINGKCPEPVFDADALTAEFQIGDVLLNAYYEPAGVPDGRLTVGVSFGVPGFLSPSQDAPPSQDALPAQYAPPLQPRTWFSSSTPILFSTFEQLHRDTEARAAFMDKVWRARRMRAEALLSAQYRADGNNNNNNANANSNSSGEQQPKKAPARPPKLDLPTWSAGVNIFQLLGLGSLLAAAYISSTGSNSNGSSRPARWLYPIHILDLLLSAHTAQRSQAVLCLVLLVWAWMTLGIGMVLVAVVLSVWRRRGWKGVRMLWVCEHGIWSAPVGSPAAAAAAAADSLEDAAEEKKERIEEGRAEVQLLVDAQ
ncbi:hypothetical protein OC834_005892 [Tilletia horrida]|nr:hypothetical protein OC834_005892 [Tilletia horrida]